MDSLHDCLMEPPQPPDRAFLVGETEAPRCGGLPEDIWYDSRMPWTFPLLSAASFCPVTWFCLAACGSPPGQPVPHCSDIVPPKERTGPSAYPSGLAAPKRFASRRLFKPWKELSRPHGYLQGCRGDRSLETGGKSSAGAPWPPSRCSDTWAFLPAGTVRGLASTSRQPVCQARPQDGGSTHRGV